MGKTDIFVQLNKFVVFVLGIVGRIFFNQQLLWDNDHCRNLPRQVVETIGVVITELKI